jgi:hypothetical protein
MAYDPKLQPTTSSDPVETNYSYFSPTYVPVIDKKTVHFTGPEYLTQPGSADYYTNHPASGATRDALCTYTHPSDDTRRGRDDTEMTRRMEAKLEELQKDSGITDGRGKIFGKFAHGWKSAQGRNRKHILR